MKYKDEVARYEREKLNKMLTAMPDYFKTFFTSKDITVTIKTQTAYATDLKNFLEFILETNPIYRGKELKEIPLDMFDNITPVDIEEYLSYLSGYNKQGEWITNSKEAKQRKLASLRAFYKYFNKRGFLKTNPASAVDTPVLDEKEIIALTENEVKDFLNVVETGNGLSKKEKDFHSKTVIRDTTIYTILLGTGIRISELVGLNLKDVDLENRQMKITRKGGKEQRISFGESVADALEFYIEVGRQQFIENDDEDALFLSLRKKRISVRQVEDMTKKYAEIAVPTKHITPHKMRSTFGTYLYNATEDPALVASMLGHSSTDITMKKYAKMDTRRVAEAANILDKLV